MLSQRAVERGASAWHQRVLGFAVRIGCLDATCQELKNVNFGEKDASRPVSDSALGSALMYW